MLSRVPITEEMVHIPSFIRSCALPFQTSVPCERPEICKRSAKVLGCASKSIWQTNDVPISGMESVPVFQLISSGVTPSGSGEVQSFIISGSQISMSVTFMPSYPQGACRAWEHRGRARQASIWCHALNGSRSASSPYRFRYRRQGTERG